MVRTHAVGQQLAELSCQSLPQAWHCLGRPLKPSSLSLPQSSGMSPKLREPLGHNAFLAPLGKWQATTPCKRGGTSSCSPRRCSTLLHVEGAGTASRPRSSPSGAVPDGWLVSARNFGETCPVLAVAGLGTMMKRQRRLPGRPDAVPWPLKGSSHVPVLPWCLRHSWTTRLMLFPSCKPNTPAPPLPARLSSL